MKSHAAILAATIAALTQNNALAEDKPAAPATPDVHLQSGGRVTVTCKESGTSVCPPGVVCYNVDPCKPKPQRTYRPRPKPVAAPLPPAPVAAPAPVAPVMMVAAPSAPTCTLYPDKSFATVGEYVDVRMVTGGGPVAQASIAGHQVGVVGGHMVIPAASAGKQDITGIVVSPAGATGTCQASVIVQAPAPPAAIVAPVQTAVTETTESSKTRKVVRETVVNCGPVCITLAVVGSATAVGLTAFGVAMATRRGEPTVCADKDPKTQEACIKAASMGLTSSGQSGIPVAKNIGIQAGAIPYGAGLAVVGRW